MAREVIDALVISGHFENCRLLRGPPVTCHFTDPAAVLRAADSTLAIETLPATATAAYRSSETPFGNVSAVQPREVLSKNSVIWLSSPDCAQRCG